MNAAASPRLAVALGSGAARGYAHFGVLQVLRERGLEPDLVVGSSMGALVGAAVVAAGDIDLAMRRFRVALADPYVMENLNLDRLVGASEQGVWDDFLGLMRKGLTLAQSVMRDSLVTDDLYRRVLRELLPYTRIETLPATFACVSTNLSSGRRQVWTEGPLIEAVGASCAIPGVFPAVEVDGELHVDGGWVESVPVLAARELGADFVLAVEIDDDPLEHVPERAVEVLLAANKVTRRTLTMLQASGADLVLQPKVRGVHWAEFRKLDELLEVGREAALERIDEITAAWEEARRGRQKGYSAWRWIPWVGDSRAS